MLSEMLTLHEYCASSGNSVAGNGSAVETLTLLAALLGSLGLQENLGPENAP